LFSVSWKAALQRRGVFNDLLEKHEEIQKEFLVQRNSKNFLHMKTKRFSLCLKIAKRFKEVDQKDLFRKKVYQKIHFGSTLFLKGLKKGLWKLEKN